MPRFCRPHRRLYGAHQWQLFTRRHQRANLLRGQLVHNAQMRSQVGHAAADSSTENAGGEARVHLAVVVEGDSAGVDLAAYVTSIAF